MPEAGSRIVRSLRSDHTWPGPRGVWAFDCWGHVGRPVLLLHGPTLDRSAWWPVAAELAADHLVVAVDLPGHGESPGRPSYEAATLAEELAELLHYLDARRAPIVVGHAQSAIIASMFGAAFATHAIIDIEQRLDVHPIPADKAISASPTRLDTIPEQYHTLVLPKTDAALVGDYLRWRSGPSAGDIDARLAETLRRIQAPLLSIFGELPWPEYASWLTTLIPNARCIDYQVGGAVPHLGHLERFVRDVRSLS